ncbi:uncharacterized protein LOC124815107 isoform X2 [Hydra vulgaris]|uniref:uncharacterized protein LOC124815107 isoform X2 n=1 Tax=Hydra vulgaris TaxID=6087 RepID=UPI001F5FD7AE|nr:uncharacterized protein LOC124815107 isoform X2 [Hydra vulgaris]
MSEEIIIKDLIFTLLSKNVVEDVAELSEELQINEYISDMTKVYKKFGRKFTKDNEICNNAIESQNMMDENEETKMGSMLTGFMRVGKLSEVEKIFKEWKAKKKKSRKAPQMNIKAQVHIGCQ